MNPKDPETFSKKEKFFPYKHWGQNFLICQRVLNQIIKAADLKKSDVVLEVGPGLGALTEKLALKSGKIIAVEKDKKLAERLQKRLAVKNIKNVEIINNDILKIENRQLTKNGYLKENGYKLVANIPYYITGRLLRKFLETDFPPSLIVLTLQKEVAQRICAEPPHLSKLAIFVQFYGQPKIISYVSKNCFWPRPKIDSALIKITPRASTKKKMSKKKKELFSRLVKAGFSQPRKQLLNNLSQELNLTRQETQDWLKKNGIKPNQRAGTLTLKDWLRLTESLFLKNNKK